jgi:hypothetical protein
MSTPPIVVYGAFSSARSYLASRRATLLRASGVHVDWRVVVDETGFGAQVDELERFEAMRREMEEVVSALLPGERLPYSLAGFLTRTGAAVAGYAEAYHLGVASTIRRLFYEAFWVHAIDLEDEHSVHTLIADTLPALVDAGTWSPLAISRPARTLITSWSREWDELGRPPLPALAYQGRVRRCGNEAVAWFQTELMHRDVDVEQAQSHRLWVRSVS